MIPACKIVGHREATSVFAGARLCHMSGAGSTNPTTTEVIENARISLANGKPYDAFMPLEYYIGDNYHHGQKAEAAKLFLAAKTMFDEFDSPKEYMWGLKIAEHGFRLGKVDDARSLFQRVMGYIKEQTTRHGRDAIRLAAALTVNDLGGVVEALEISEEMEDVSPKFSVVIRIADSLVANGQMSKATELMLNHCAATARLSDRETLSAVQTKAARLLMVAEKLLKIGVKTEAESLIDEGVELLGYSSYWWVGRSGYELELLEKAAILLLEADKRDKAINLLTDGWLRQDYLDSLKPEEAEAQRLALIDHHQFSRKFSQALKSAKK